MESDTKIQKSTQLRWRSPKMPRVIHLKMLKNNALRGIQATGRKLDVFYRQESGKKFFVFMSRSYICSPIFKAEEKVYNRYG
jgi:hypothetical protein